MNCVALCLFVTFLLELILCTILVLYIVPNILTMQANIFKIGTYLKIL
jgi:hypothetical protein